MICISFGQYREMEIHMANILIADDEKEIVKLLKIYIEDENNKIFEANNGLEAIKILKSEEINLVLLDIMMPKRNGYEVIKYIRHTSNIPILVISAKVDLSDRVFGIDLGADDYIIKPFEPVEVAAKVRAHLRRSGFLNKKKELDTKKLEVGELILDCEKCIMIKNETEFELTKVEFKVMELFMKNPRRVFTKKQIYEYAWEEAYIVGDNSIRVIISRLRDKIGNESIRTIRGLGYRLD